MIMRSDLLLAHLLVQGSTLSHSPPDTLQEIKLTTSPHNEAFHLPTKSCKLYERVEIPLLF
uniref:Uncharacterized protein n=1 Tax=Lepeophtheirus salmonis TaxID=72036 RepID=A0A0K2V5D5_LEPSM